MSKIRINELARELEVKPNVILDLLPELGVGDNHDRLEAQRTRLQSPRHRVPGIGRADLGDDRRLLRRQDRRCNCGQPRQGGAGEKLPRRSRRAR